MSFTPLGLLRLRSTSSASAGGQLEQPSEVNSSMTTGVSAQEQETLHTMIRTSVMRHSHDLFMLPHRTRSHGKSCTCKPRIDTRTSFVIWEGLRVGASFVGE